ncbi:putative S-adenosyl-L-methionine-dependent methyltransferase Mvan_0910 [Juglans microcarpa x Juglans regia]|uniref:putative S-adenosyl-L-methionine-dependent methyltransferase Mvan_0910 n=1 Tax=Juglans microcarpa x Juglans regia TaxID=2249226 RepID=UPI001B7E86A6|nr:putative S-adenosyl-L-methionine-dependent methyltransferase Mvan_0910 [Juglans microcarpa x Juglans regia]
MSDQENALPTNPTWPELKLPELLFTDTVREVHATIENEWDPLLRSACQTAAGRALWKHLIHDPLADLLAGETYLTSLYEKIKKDRINNAREVSGVILAVRTLWFDSKLEAALNSFSRREAQVVILGAGMDARAYRLSCLKDSDVFEVDFPKVLQVKTTLLQAAMETTNEHQHLTLKSKSLTRVAADIRDIDWLEKLQISGFVPEKNTIWVLEGILYYLSQPQAMQVLKTIAEKCALTSTVLLADFMNKSSITLSSSIFHFYSDWPDHLLPSLGFSHVKLSQIGDPDAHFGLMHDPLNLFNRLRSLPRSLQNHPDDGTPCCRLYLVQASGSPNQTILP